MTVTDVAAPEVSREELITAVARLSERLADLAAQRDHARAKADGALETACRLQQERDAARRDALIQERLANALRAELDEAAADKRRLTQRCHELAVTAGALEQQIDRIQNQPQARPDDHTGRWPFKRAGNSL